MIRKLSPTRVDLSGGTLDCWPLNLFVPQAVTVNLAIDIHTGVELEPRSDEKIILEISDLKETKLYQNLDELLRSEDGSVVLVREVVRYVAPMLRASQSGFRLKTFSDSPIGGGLGGSSSLCISLLSAFFQWLNITQSVEKTVELAHNIEGRVLHTPTGTQDYVPALLGGLNQLTYKDSGLEIVNLPFQLDRLSGFLGLVYTGRPHHSGINNWQVIKKAVEKDRPTLQALNEIAEISLRVAEVCRSQNWGDLPYLLNKECEARIALSPVFTSPEIEELRHAAAELGADASKICGAGGGGCVLVWADPTVHVRLAEECRRRKFRHLEISAVPALKDGRAVASL